VPLTENRNLERNSLLLAYAYPLHPHARHRHTRIMPASYAAGHEDIKCHTKVPSLPPYLPDAGTSPSDTTPHVTDSQTRVERGAESRTCAIVVWREGPVRTSFSTVLTPPEPDERDQGSWCVFPGRVVEVGVEDFLYQRKQPEVLGRAESIKRGERGNK